MSLYISVGDTLVVKPQILEDGKLMILGINKLEELVKRKDKVDVLTIAIVSRLKMDIK